MKNGFAALAFAASLAVSTPASSGPYREAVEAYQSKMQEQYVLAALDHASQLRDRPQKVFALQTAGSCFAGHHIPEERFRKVVRRHGIEAAKAMLDDRELMDYLDSDYPVYQYALTNLYRLNEQGWTELCKLAFGSNVAGRD